MKQMRCHYQEGTADSSQTMDIIRSLQLRPCESTSTLTVLSRCKHVYSNKCNCSFLDSLC